jgi:hypothetical protein
MCDMCAGLYSSEATLLQQSLYSSTAAPYRPPSAIPYSSNEGMGAFMEREIEGACMTKAFMCHPQFSSSLDAFYI